MLDVAHTMLGKFLEALLHFNRRAPQDVGGLFRLGDDGGEEVRDAVVETEFQPLRVDHDELDFVGR